MCQHANAPTRQLLSTIHLTLSTIRYPTVSQFEPCLYLCVSKIIPNTDGCTGRCDDVDYDRNGIVCSYCDRTIPGGLIDSYFDLRQPCGHNFRFSALNSSCTLVKGAIGGLGVNIPGNKKYEKLKTDKSQDFSPTV
jgi:hypothetical protein